MIKHLLSFVVLFTAAGCGSDANPLKKDSASDDKKSSAFCDQTSEPQACTLEYSPWLCGVTLPADSPIAKGGNESGSVTRIGNELTVNEDNECITRQALLTTLCDADAATAEGLYTQATCEANHEVGVDFTE